MAVAKYPVQSKFCRSPYSTAAGATGCNISTPLRAARRVHRPWHTKPLLCLVPDAVGAGDLVAAPEGDGYLAESRRGQVGGLRSGSSQEQAYQPPRQAETRLAGSPARLAGGLLPEAPVGLFAEGDRYECNLFNVLAPLFKEIDDTVGVERPDMRTVGRSQR